MSDVAMLRRLANEPQQFALSADATELIRDVKVLAGNFPDVHGQRFVPVRLVRQVLDLPGDRFDRAVNEAANLYLVWLRVPAMTSAEDDAAAVRHRGTDYHQISTDSWRREQR